MKAIFATFIVILCLVSFGTPAHAQAPTGVIKLSVLPNAPRPGTSMSARVESFLTDINQATVSWYVDGALQTSGVGLTKFSFPSPQLGEGVTLRVVVQTIDRGTVEESQSIRSGSVDLVWEADSYTPPFYRGKALYPAQAGVRIVALPHFPNFDPEELIYTWENNGTVLGSLSGTGRSVLNLSRKLFPTERRISVGVRTPSGLTKAFADITIPVSNSFVRFYEYSPTLGALFNNAPRSPYVLPRDEVRLEGYPYFFSTSDRRFLSNSWRVNGQKIEPTDGPFGLTLRRENGSGEATVVLSASSLSHILQRTSVSLRIQF